jgi:LacI family transcriptional regulator
MIPRVTQKDLARAAGVHPATVSLALRSHASIPTKTRERIQRLAERLGYKADPLLNALADYRARRAERRPPHYRTIALVDNWPKGLSWHATPDHTRTRASVLARAKELGFQALEIHATIDQQTQMRTSRKLFQMGIRGIILAPQPRELPPLAFDWHRFTVVNLGNRLLEPVFHCSMPDIFANYRILVKTLFTRGYRRLGTYFPLLVGVDTQDAYSSLFIAGNLLSWHGSKMFFAEPLVLPEWNRDTFLRWVCENQLDVVATSEPEIPGVLEQAGFRIPDDIGVAYTPCRTHPSASGVYTSEESIGATAVDLLQSQLHLCRLGIPKYPMRMSHPGVWIEGTTIRQQDLPLTQPQRGR